MKDFTRLDDLLKRFVDEGTNPGCAVAVMQGDELFLHICTSAHLLRAPDQHPDLTAADFAEQFLFLRLCLSIVDEGNLFLRDSFSE